MILQEAQRRSEQLLTQSRSEADGIRNEADDYVMEESLNQLQAELERIANQVRNGIRTVEEEQTRRAPASAPISQPVDK